MKIFDTDSIRNVALIGHSGEGKTSLAEAMMFEAKTIDRLGKVDDGSSTMDYDDEEIKRKISISLSLGYALYRNTKINILDAPGFFDFEGEMIAALHAADSAVVVTSASGSLTVGTEKALDLCKEKKVAALVFVNAVDKDNSDFTGTARAIMAKYKSVIPIELPIMEGGKMVGVVDVLNNKAFDLQNKEIAVPASLQGEVEEFNGKLMELIAETDEELMMKFFDGEQFTKEEIQKGLHQAIADDIFVPLVAGNAQTSKGVARLMDKLVDLMPHPQRAHKIKAIVDGKETEVGVDPSAPFSAQVIKSVVDPYVGKLLIFLSSKFSAVSFQAVTQCTTQALTNPKKSVLFTSSKAKSKSPSIASTQVTSVLLQSSFIPTPTILWYLLRTTRSSLRRSNSPSPLSLMRLRPSKTKKKPFKVLSRCKKKTQPSRWKRTSKPVTFSSAVLVKRNLTLCASA